MGWCGGGVVGPFDFSVSPSPFGLDFGTLDFGLGLDKIYSLCFLTIYCTYIFLRIKFPNKSLSPMGVLLRRIISKQLIIDHRMFKTQYDRYNIFCLR